MGLLLCRVNVIALGAEPLGCYVAEHSTSPDVCHCRCKETAAMRDCCMLGWDSPHEPLNPTAFLSVIFVGNVDPYLVGKAHEVGTLIYRAHPAAHIGHGAASQLSRLYSYALPYVQPDDYLLSVDADAWPLANAFAPSGAPVDLLYPACADLAETPYFPIGYIGALARSWRSFMGEAASPEAGLVAAYASDPYLSKGHTGWNYDETLVTRRLKAWPSFRQARLTKRYGDPPVDRIDRAAWPSHFPEDGKLAGKIDAHLLRPAWTEENWPRLRPLLAARLSKASLTFADDYRATWLRNLPPGDKT